MMRSNQAEIKANPGISSPHLAGTKLDPKGNESRKHINVLGLHRSTSTWPQDRSGETKELIKKLLKTLIKTLIKNIVNVLIKTLITRQLEVN